LLFFLKNDFVNWRTGRTGSAWKKGCGGEEGGKGQGGKIAQIMYAYMNK
jgi:hypothetical protein